MRGALRPGGGGQEGEGKVDRTGGMGCQLAITVTQVGEVKLQSAAELALSVKRSPHSILVLLMPALRGRAQRWCVDLTHALLE